MRARRYHTRTHAQTQTEKTAWSPERHMHSTRVSSVQYVSRTHSTKQIRNAEEFILFNKICIRNANIDH